MKSIHPWLFIGAIILNLLAVRIGALVLPNKLYFSFSAFLFDNRDLLKVQAIAAKLAIPFIAAFLAAALIDRAARAQAAVEGNDGSMVRLLQDQLPLTLAFSASLTAFLMAWPFILLWDLLVDPVLSHQRLLFLLAYVAYVVGYGYFALSGAETAIIVLAPRPTPEDGSERPRLTLSRLVESPLIQPLWTALSGTAVTALAAFLATRGG